MAQVHYTAPHGELRPFGLVPAFKVGEQQGEERDIGKFDRCAIAQDVGRRRSAEYNRRVSWRDTPDAVRGDSPAVGPCGVGTGARGGGRRPGGALNRCLLCTIAMVLPPTQGSGGIRDQTCEQRRTTGDTSRDRCSHRLTRTSGWPTVGYECGEDKAIRLRRSGRRRTRGDRVFVAISVGQQGVPNNVRSRRRERICMAGSGLRRLDPSYDDKVRLDIRTRLPPGGLRYPAGKQVGGGPSKCAGSWSFPETLVLEGRRLAGRGYRGIHQDVRNNILLQARVVVRACGMSPGDLFLEVNFSVKENHVNVIRHVAFKLNRRKSPSIPPSFESLGL